jgi:ABC-2 type transport system ATP-binding protein
MIQVNNIKTYNGTTVLKNRFFRNKKGESFWLSGNNGAGKTTFQFAFRFNQPSTGNIINHGVQVNSSEAWKPLQHRS